MLALHRMGSSFAAAEFIFKCLNSRFHTNLDFHSCGITWHPIEFLDNVSLEEIDPAAITAIVHAAGQVDFSYSQRNKILQSNLALTDAVVQYASNHTLPLGYISSTSTLNRKHKGSTTESFETENIGQRSAYGVGKLRAEMTVWRAIHEGLCAAIINPGILLGPGDFRKGSLKMVTRASQGLTLAPAGSNGFTDASDAARAIVELMENQMFGERYVCVGFNISYLNLFQRIAAAAGTHPPKKVLSPALAYSTAKALEIWSKISGHDPFISPDLLRTTSRHAQYQSSKLEKALEFQFTPMDDTITFTMEALAAAPLHGLV